jgi:hypothetical protein
MNKWHCDECGKATSMNPPIEAVFEDKEQTVEVPVFDPLDPTKFTIEKRTMKTRVPVMIKHQRQNLSTGKMEEVETQKIRDLEPRTIIVQVRTGPDSLQRDFCQACFDKKIKPLLKPVWEYLSGVQGID